MTTFHFHFAGTKTTIEFVESFLPLRTTDRILSQVDLGDGVVSLGVSSINYSRRKGAVIKALDLCCPELIYEVCNKNDVRLYESWTGQHSNYCMLSQEAPFAQAAKIFVAPRTKIKPTLEDIRRKWSEQINDPVALSLELLPVNPLLSTAIRSTTRVVEEAENLAQLDIGITFLEPSAYYLQIINMIRIGMGFAPFQATSQTKHAFPRTEADLAQ